MWGGVSSVTVSWVVVAAVTVPVMDSNWLPRVKATTFWEGVAENDVPVMTTGDPLPHTYAFCGVAVMFALGCTVCTFVGVPGGATAVPAASMPVWAATLRLSLPRSGLFLFSSAVALGLSDARAATAAVKFFFLKKPGLPITSNVSKSES